MAHGSIEKRDTTQGVHYRARADLGPDPVTGKRRQRNKTFTTKKQAQTWLNCTLAAVDSGCAVDTSRQLLRDYLLQWLASKEQHVKETTFADYRWLVERHILPQLGAVPLGQLSPSHIQNWIDEKRRVGRLDGAGALSSARVHSARALLRQALGHAVRFGLLPRNVVELTTAPRIARHELQTWTPAQTRAFLAVAEQHGLAALWFLAILTGMRRGELLGLRWQDVDLELGMLQVRQQVVQLQGSPHITGLKTSTSRRTLPLTTSMVQALRNHRAQQLEHRLRITAAWQDYDLVFPANNGKPLHPSNVIRTFAALQEAARVPRIRFHDLRHTAATYAHSGGTDLKTLSMHLGHSKVSTTSDIYVQGMAEQQKEVAHRIEQLIYGCTG